MIRKEGYGEKTTRNLKSPKKREKIPVFMSDQETGKHKKQPRNRQAKPKTKDKPKMKMETDR